MRYNDRPANFFFNKKGNYFPYFLSKRICFVFTFSTKKRERKNLSFYNIYNKYLCDKK